MLTEYEAKGMINHWLAEQGRHVTGGLALLGEKTIAKPYGWIFFYDASRYLETRNLLDAIAGNGPVVVLATGEIVALGSAKTPEEEILEFERLRML